MSIKYLNSNRKCICCGKGREKEKCSNFTLNGKPIIQYIPLIKHHVSYKPEIVAYVHLQCHLDIHEGKYPHLIQYQEGESKEYYRNKTTVKVK